MLTELQLINKITSSEYVKHISIQVPWDSTPKPLNGFYRNPDDNNSIFFYSNDRVGLKLSTHYQKLVVKDYLGRYRPFIEKHDSSTYKCYFDLKEPKIVNSDLIPMQLLLDDLKPGDFFREDEDMILTPIIEVLPREENHIVLKIFSHTIAPDLPLVVIREFTHESGVFYKFYSDQFYTFIQL